MNTVQLGLFEQWQYRVLCIISPDEPDIMNGAAFCGKSKLRELLGEDTVRALIGAGTVIDFGCGHGEQAIELAKLGCERVIGIDIVEEYLQKARASAAKEGVEDTCSFTQTASEPAGAIVALDSFEHFHDPAGILDSMYSLLKPGGIVYTSFGPTWFHPLGGHLFSVFPWAHLLFSERALIAWRSRIRSDGATRFSEVLGGLNQMTIRRFEKLVKASRFELEVFRCKPIRKLKLCHNRFTREFCTAVVFAALRKP